ncbi:hypothetical protein HD806DRAFT_531407 [Xylariaceae sp. AK1471]|nr:hypothetical protein HD806DRAFT_531407 [Xylariaceae sp. AK1471]
MSHLGGLAVLDSDAAQCCCVLSAACSVLRWVAMLLECRSSPTDVPPRDGVREGLARRQLPLGVEAAEVAAMVDELSCGREKGERRAVRDLEKDWGWRDGRFLGLTKP